MSSLRVLKSISSAFILCVLFSACAERMEKKTGHFNGTYTLTKSDTPGHGFKSIQFKDNGVAVLNGDLLSTYNVHKGVVVIKAGIYEDTGEFERDTLRLGKCTYTKQ